MNKSITGFLKENLKMKIYSVSTNTLLSCATEILRNIEWLLDHYLFTIMPSGMSQIGTRD